MEFSASDAQLACLLGVTQLQALADAEHSVSA
jgi:hypothetical protein